jgi:cytochrome c5
MRIRGTCKERCMPKRIYLLIAFLLAATVVTPGCGQAATEVSTATPIPAPETEPPGPTATPEATEIIATEEPTAEPTELEPMPTATPKPEEPTGTPEPEEPTATSEPTAEPAAPEGQVLLEERCTACHGLDRVANVQKSREEWEATVDRMVGYGAELSESERTILLDYLVETYGP